MRDSKRILLPALRSLYSPVIYAAVSALAVLEAETYVGAVGVEYGWGHVRWELVQSRRSVLTMGNGDQLDWCFFVESLQQATATNPHSRSEAQRMLENFVRARLGRQPQVRIEIAGPISMLRLRVRTDRAAAAWFSLRNVFELIPMWASFIEQCLLDMPNATINKPHQESFDGWLFQESK